MKKAYLGLASVALLLCGVGLSQAGPIINGGYESGDFSPGWGRLPDNESGANTFATAGAAGIAPFDGTYFATFSNHSPNVSGITQTVSTTAGQDYVLSYWFTNSSGADQLNEFKVTWDGNVLTDSIGFASLGAVWKNKSFLVTGTGSDTVAFSGYQNSGYNGLDDVSCVPLLPGDFNASGTVDAADYVLWRKYQGTTHVLPNDPTGGTIGAVQYTTWRANFGKPPGSGSGTTVSAAVPEPTSFVLLTFAAAVLTTRRRW
jgi:hypothetical protein